LEPKIMDKIVSYMLAAKGGKLSKG
jgi:hypothetical protein